jgi:DNA primase
MNPVDEIKARLSIVDVVSQYIDLKKAGNNYKGLSPFNKERTPSFFVSPSKGFFHCFSSNKGGDIFTFVQELEGVDFAGSLKILAEKAGVELKKQDPKKLKELELQYSAMEESAKWYQKALTKNSEVLKYLDSRGIKKDTIDDFRIGFVGDSWRDMSEALISEKKFKTETLEAVGLVKKNDKGHYDIFRNRVMFPIMDSTGRVIAFSGRLFGEPDKSADFVPPKYVNSPDTPLYNKSDSLFGIHIAKQYIRQFEYAILVEGQFDVISLHQIGFKNTVGISGTAFTGSLTNEGTETVNNIGLINRLTKNLLLALDSDKAGIKAAIRTSMIALSLGMNVKIVSVGDGMDPADLVLSKGKKGWVEVQKKATHVIYFVLDNILREEKDQTKITKRIVIEILPLVKQLPSSSEQSSYISEIANKSSISFDALWSDLASVDIQEEKMKTSENKKEKTQKIDVVRFVVGVEGWLSKEDDKKDLYEGFEKKIYEIVTPEKFNSIKEYCKDEIERLSFISEIEFQEKEKLEDDLDELLIRFELHFLERDMKEKRKKLLDFEKENNEEGMSKISKEITDILNKIDKCKRVLTSVEI